MSEDSCCAMSERLQLLWLFVLAAPVACVAWTVHHEEVFKVFTGGPFARAKSALAYSSRSFSICSRVNPASATTLLPARFRSRAIACCCRIGAARSSRGSRSCGSRTSTSACSAGCGSTSSTNTSRSRRKSSKWNGKRKRKRPLYRLRVRLRARRDCRPARPPARPANRAQEKRRHTFVTRALLDGLFRRRRLPTGMCLVARRTPAAERIPSHRHRASRDPSRHPRWAAARMRRRIPPGLRRRPWR